MLQRMFGRRRPPPEPEENIEGGFVLLSDNSSPEPAYTLPGAAAFYSEANSRSSTATSCQSPSHDDPLDGVPFKVTLNLSEEAPETSLSEAIAIVTRMEATDWDDYDYNFKLEQSVLDECNNKILVRNES